MILMSSWRYAFFASVTDSTVVTNSNLLNLYDAFLRKNESIVSRLKPDRNSKTATATPKSLISETSLAVWNVPFWRASPKLSFFSGDLVVINTIYHFFYWFLYKICIAKQRRSYKYCYLVAYRLVISFDMSGQLLF